MSIIVFFGFSSLIFVISSIYVFIAIKNLISKRNKIATSLSQKSSLEI